MVLKFFWFQNAIQGEKQQAFLQLLSWVLSMSGTSFVLQKQQSFSNYPNWVSNFLLLFLVIVIMSYSGEFLLHLTQKCKKLQKQMKQIHSLIITNGHLHQHQNVPSSSLSLPWMPTLLYNALISAYHIHNHNKALSIFTHMLANQAPPNSHTFPPLLKISPLPLGATLHSQTLKRGLLSDGFILTTLLALYARNHLLPHARMVFEEFPMFCIVACNAMINAFSMNGDMEAVVALFERMSQRDVFSWTIVDSFALNGNFDASIRFFRKMMIHKDVVDGLVKPNEVTCSGVLSSCANLDGKTDKKIYRY